MPNRSTLHDNLINNVRVLQRELGVNKSELSRRSGVSLRMINYILNGEKKASIAITEQLAKAFGLSGWQLLLPTLNAEMISTGSLDQLIADFSKSSREGRDYIMRIADREAKYGNK